MSHLNQLRSQYPAEPFAAEGTVCHSSGQWLEGSSPSIIQLRGQIRRLAPYFRTALIVGEPACGDEAAAHILHQLSPLSGRPFLDLSSAPFTPSTADRTPDNALAGMGMVFISHPEQLSHTAQTALLRVLRKHGPEAPRVVAFVQRSLRPLVSASGFSAELADHIGALRIPLPPLRERRDDIPQLLAYILETIAAQSGARVPELALDLLEAAQLLPWRGNLTQLYSAAQGLMERATHLILHAPDLNAVLGALSPGSSPYHPEVRMIRLDDVIQEHIRAVLYASNGNKLRTAEVLGISRSTLYRMLEIPSHHNVQALSPADLQMTC